MTTARLKKQFPEKEVKPEDIKIEFVPEKKPKGLKNRYETAKTEKDILEMEQERIFKKG